MQDLESQWALLASTYSPDQKLIRKLWSEIHQSYTSSGRYYHNLHHIESLLNLAAEHKTLVQRMGLLRFAIFYHDIIYKTTRSDNEVKSAALAAERLQELRMPDEEIKTVKVMILATKTHQQHQQTDVNLMVDFDLSVLGASWEKYVVYSQQIRKEYSLYPDMLYNKGRKKVLQHFLSQPSIYKTVLFQEKRETQARQNLQRELIAL